MTSGYDAATWATAFNLYFNNVSVNPSHDHLRQRGYPVRCLVILVCTSSVADLLTCMSVP